MFELHTSDFDPCPARAVLRRRCAFDGVAGTALVRGLAAHTALENLHKDTSELTSDLVQHALASTVDMLASEGREASDAVERNIGSMASEIVTMLESYRRRILPLTSKWTLLGTEVPVYWELRDDVHLSSRVDVLYIDENERAICWDWKWRKDALAISDLSRNLQLACYWGALIDGGLFQLKANERASGWDCSGDGWYSLPDGSKVPLVSWVDLPSLKPYARATMGQDDSGRAIQYKKGDDRPVCRVIRTPNFHPKQLGNIKDAALVRADMIINGTAPYIPQGCSHCECEPWCPRFDMATTSEYHGVTTKGDSV